MTINVINMALFLLTLYLLYALHSYNCMFCCFHLRHNCVFLYDLCDYSFMALSYFILPLLCIFTVCGRFIFPCSWKWNLEPCLCYRVLQLTHACAFFTDSTVYFCFFGLTCGDRINKCKFGDAFIMLEGVWTV